MTYYQNFDERYVIDGQVGEGAFGCVMRCKQKATGRWFAAKIMKATCPDFSEVSNLKEISILRKIPEHLNVLKLREIYVNRTTRQVTLVFPLMDLNLEEYIRTQRDISEKRSKEILYQIVIGLNHLHSHKVFHRDIKPENILLRGDLVVIGDMGSMQYIKPKGLHTEYIATRWYRSPECLLTEGYYSSELDIWAAGCVFYETLTGVPLFPGESEIDQLDRIHQVLGTPKPESLKKYEKYKSTNFTYHFKNYPGQGINITKPLHEKGKKLLYEMLKYDPKRRATAAKILQSMYFADLGVLKQYIEQKQAMNKLALKHGTMQKHSHPNNMLARSSMRTDMSKLVQSEVMKTQPKRTKSDFFSHQMPASKYKFETSNNVVVHPKKLEQPSTVLFRPRNLADASSNVILRPRNLDANSNVLLRPRNLDATSNTLLRAKNLDKSSTLLLRPRNLSKRHASERQLTEAESRRKIQSEFLERKSKIKQKLNLLF